MHIIPCSCLQLTVCTSCLVVVFTTQPQAVTSMLVHVHVPSYLAVHALVLFFYNMQSIGSVSHVHLPVLAS